ncbi:MAG: Spy/CpxP family protein refolding chaperone [Balneolaceae bacterium]|nr:Spy/CpxP family protein refolding chaperone [Balneolaceae bacterium]
MLVAGSTLAQQGPPRRADLNRPGMGQYDGNRMLRGIPDLTDQQREQIRQVHLDARQQGLAFQNQINEKRARLRTLTTGDEIDMDAANAVVEELGALRTQLMKHRLQIRMQVRQLLTDEQRVVFDSRSAMAGSRKGMAGIKQRCWQ